MYSRLFIFKNCRKNFRPLGKNWEKKKMKPQTLRTSSVKHWRATDLQPHPKRILKFVMKQSKMYYH